MKRLGIALLVGLLVEGALWFLPDDSLKSVLLFPSALAVPFLRFGERVGFATILIVPGVVYATLVWAALFAISCFRKKASA